MHLGRNIRGEHQVGRGGSAGGRGCIQDEAALHGLVGGAENRHDGAAHLAVRAVPGLALWRVLSLGSAGRNPGAHILHGALLAGRGLRGADQRTELHGRRVPHAGGWGIGGHECLGQAGFGGRQRAGGERLAANGAGVHAANIRVDDRLSQTERENADGGGRVGAHARQVEERIVVGGNLTIMPLHNRHGSPVQALSAARVTQATPGAHRLRGGLGGQVCGGGPAAHPLLPDGQDALDGGLL